MKQILILLPAAAVLAFACAAWADAASEAQLKDELAKTQAELARYKDGFERANAALGQVNTQVAELNAERQKAAADKTYAGKQLEYCQAKNVYLIGVGEQILTEASKKRPIPDPFTQLMRVKLENQQQEYEDKIRAGRFDPRLDRPAADAAPAAAAAPPAAPPAKTDQPPAKPDGGS